MSGLDYSPLAHDELVRLCSRSINTIDGLWFLAIEQKYGLDTALELDTEVWREATKINARRLLKGRSWLQQGRQPSSRVILTTPKVL